MADQHNDNIPAVTNQIVNDIPDIKENLEYHLDLFNNFCGTVSKTDATGVYPGSWGRVAKTSDYTLTDTDYWIDVSASGAAVTLTLPTASSAGAGRYYMVKLNDATYNCIIDGNGSETIDGEATFALTIADEAILIICDGSNWNVLCYYAPKTASGAKALPLPRGYLSGLTLSNDTDTEHDINVTAGECRDSSNTYNIVLSSEITKQIDATWAAGDDGGGMNGGEAVGATTWYHVHLLFSPSTGNVDVGFDTSLTATNLLADAAVVTAGHTKYRRIGSVLTNSSNNILQFVQVGDEFIWSDPQREENISASGTSTVALDLSSPTGVKCKATFNIYATDTAALKAYLRHADNSDETVSTINAPLASISGEANVNVFGQYTLMTNTSSQVYFRTDSSINTVRVSTLSYTDRRGRDD